LEFDNINSDRGIPIEEISEIIVQKMMGKIFIEKGLKAIIEAPINIIKGVIPFLSLLFKPIGSKQEIRDVFASNTQEFFLPRESEEASGPLHD
jgi:hypothetical protein